MSIFFKHRYKRNLVGNSSELNFGFRRYSLTLEQLVTPILTLGTDGDTISIFNTTDYSDYSITYTWKAAPEEGSESEYSDITLTSGSESSIYMPDFTDSLINAFDTDHCRVYVTVSATGMKPATSEYLDHPKQLDTPTNLSISDQILKFDAVENATSYEVYADGKSIGTYTVYTLSFASVVGTVTVNDVEVTSPYTLKNGDVIVITRTVEKGFYPDAGAAKAVWAVNGEDVLIQNYEVTIDRSDTDLSITLVGSMWKGTHVMTINFTTTPSVASVILDDGTSVQTIIADEEAVNEIKIGG